MFRIIAFLLFVTWIQSAVLTQVSFVDISEISGIDQSSNSEAVSIADYNNDGHDDLYISHLDGPNQLYHNNGDNTFTEIASQLSIDLSSRSKTSLWIDINNDGWLDLYVANQRENDQLYLNEKGQSFKEITTSAGVDNVSFPQNVIAADYNSDSYIDIYVVNIDRENILYHNNGDNTFSIATYDAGVPDAQTSMGAIFFDYDNDEHVDLYLVHDNFQPNILYHNNGDGTYEDVSAAANVDTKAYGMAVDVADINNDGYMDMYITNLFQNVLLLNQGDGSFEDISKSAGIDDFGMGWGITFFDCNLDGYMDIYVANDSKFSPESNILYSNNGDLTFTQIASEEDVSSNLESFAAAKMDINQDGRPDLIVANRGEEEKLSIFQNNLETNNHWIGLKLIGTESNSYAVGAKVTITDGHGFFNKQEVTAGHGWTSQNSSNLIFGLGDNQGFKDVLIEWPSGSIQNLRITKLNNYYTITEDQGITEGINADFTTTTQDILSITQLNKVFPSLLNSGNSELTIKTSTKEPNVIITSSDGQKIDASNYLRQIDDTTYSLKLNEGAHTRLCGLLYITISSSHSYSTHPIIISE